MTNEKLLRETIRLIIESQGQTTSRGDPATTSPGFKPFSLVPGIVIAAGVAGLTQIHDWVGGLCTALPPEKAKFPINLSEKYAKLLVKSRERDPNARIDDNVWKKYQDSLKADGDASFFGGNVTDQTSDLVNLQELYNDLTSAANAWTGGNDFEMTDKDKVASALSSAYERFSGCTNIFTADNFPVEIKSRASYIKFLKDIASLSHNSFVDGLNSQNASLYRVNNAKTHNVSGIITESKKEEITSYTRTMTDIK